MPHMIVTDVVWWEDDNAWQSMCSSWAVIAYVWFVSLLLYGLDNPLQYTDEPLGPSPEQYWLLIQIYNLYTKRTVNCYCRLTPSVPRRIHCIWSILSWMCFISWRLYLGRKFHVFVLSCGGCIFVWWVTTINLWSWFVILLRKI
jgi:hypothetical protein